MGGVRFFVSCMLATLRLNFATVRRCGHLRCREAAGRAAIFSAAAKDRLPPTGHSLGTFTERR